MKCVVCGHPAMDRFIYCARCFKFIERTSFKLARRRAMIAAWNKAEDGFFCRYTGLRLEEYDTASPFFMTFDHPVPGDNTRLLASARFINELKSAMTELEFRTNIPLLARHLTTGEPIDRNLFKVDHFPITAKKKRFGKSVPEPDEPERDWYTDTCLICGHEPGKSMLYCTRCQRLMYKQGDRIAKRKALIEAYDRSNDGFRCFFTGFLLILEGHSGPWLLNYDHRKPGQPGDYVIACSLVNEMKSQLSAEEFIKVVIELARHFETGEAYNRDIIKFEYWIRPR